MSEGGAGKKAVARKRVRTGKRLPPLDRRPEWANEPEVHPLLTLIMRAGEFITTSNYPIGREGSPAPTASSHGPERSAGSEMADLSGLLQGIHSLQSLLDRDPELQSSLEKLPPLLGKGSTLPLLYEHLFPRLPPDPTPDKNGKAILTKAEVQRLQDLAYGDTYQEIAAKHNLSPRTVQTQINQIYHKLGVHTPIRAIARAIALGYLDLDAVHFVRGANGSWLRYHRLVENLFTAPQDPQRYPELDRLQPLAAFGLFLLAACGAAARQVQGDLGYQPRRAGRLCRLDGTGKVVHSVLPPGMGQIRFLVVAPAHASRQGFVPGHLYAAHDYLPQHHLNRGAISEFTATGEWVRTFLGGAEAQTRLAGPLSLAFHPDGRLLATSGLPADAILAFSVGGSQVRRFRAGLFHQIYAAPDGCIYGIENTTAQGVIQILRPDGTSLRTLPPIPDEKVPLGLLYGVVVDSTGRFFVLRDLERSRGLDEYAPDGVYQRTHYVSDSNNGQLALDAQGRLLLASATERVVKVLSSSGEVLQRIDLRGQLVPTAVVGAGNNGLWVAGGADPGANGH